jgi:hypothetical protein
MCEVIKHCLKYLNRQYGEQHAKSVEAKVVNKAELKYNPDEMQKILKELLGSETLKEMMEEFSNGGLGRMADEGLIDKKEACYFILSILLVEGFGQRHSAYTNMTQRELYSPEKINELGAIVVQVVRHKTAHFNGAAAIPLFDKNFYRIICEYWKTFQESSYNMVRGNGSSLLPRISLHRRWRTRSIGSKRRCWSKNLVGPWSRSRS